MSQVQYKSIYRYTDRHSIHSAQIAACSKLVLCGCQELCNDILKHQITFPPFHLSAGAMAPNPVLTCERVSWPVYFGWASSICFPQNLKVTGSRLSRPLFTQRSESRTKNALCGGGGGGGGGGHGQFQKSLCGFGRVCHCLLE